jgi:long-chain fatty acid transport protein
MYRFSALWAVAAGVTVLAAAGTARAQGYGVYEQGACMMGRAGAGVAAPCSDGSGAFFNPAGLSFDTPQATLGGVLIGPRGDFTDSTTGAVSTLNNHWYPAPNIYVSSPVGKQMALGVGVFAPYGLTTDWPTTSEGRFLGYKALVQAIYVQPTVSFKVNGRMSLGFGVDITHTSVELRQRVDLSSQPFGPGTFGSVLGVLPGTDFADLDLQGSAWHAGYHLGLLFKANDKVSFGVRYLSGQKVNVTNGTLSTSQIPAVKPDGTPYVLPISIPGVAPAGTPLDLLVRGAFAPGGTLSNQSASSSLPLPAQFVAGVAVQATPTLKLLADYQFTRWSAFDQLPITGQYLQNIVVENYGDTSGVRFGVELAATPKTTFRAGIDLHEAAAPDATVTPNLPEASRREFNVGVGRQLSKSARLDIAYMYLSQPTRDGRTGALPNNGAYDFSANLFSAALNVRF